ncbi:MAG: NAD(P)/FAD-dependent oxidoreductase [Pseudomonadota bacterium]
MQDTVIVGGSFAGLSAALQLGRARRKVTVVNSGSPRNAPSQAAHGVPGWDGTKPANILEKFRNDVDAYPSIGFVEDKVTRVQAIDGGFEVAMASTKVVKSKRIILAHGVHDTLPDIPGAREAWGRTLLHCPYCHGYEVRDRPLAVLANHAMSGHQAELLRSDWSDEVTVLTGTAGDFDINSVEENRFSHDPRSVVRLASGNSGVTVTFQDGQTAEFAAIFVAPRVSFGGTPAADLGCATADGPLGPYVQVGLMGQTSVAGVFAAGDCARPGHNVTSAIGDGATAGIGCHQSLIFPTFVQPLEDSSHD